MVEGFGRGGRYCLEVEPERRGGRPRHGHGGRDRGHDHTDRDKEGKSLRPASVPGGCARDSSWWDVCWDGGNPLVRLSGILADHPRQGRIVRTIRDWTCRRCGFVRTIRPTRLSRGVLRRVCRWRRHRGALCCGRFVEARRELVAG